jgi:hypothetical protein
MASARIARILAGAGIRVVAYVEMLRRPLDASG